MSANAEALLFEGNGMRVIGAIQKPAEDLGWRVRVWLYNRLARLPVGEQ